MISRNIDPQKCGVVSVTQVHGGDTYNVIPQNVRLSGCTRYFDNDVKALIRARIFEVCAGVGTVHSVRVEPVYRSVYPPTTNHAASQQSVLNAAASIVPKTQIFSDLPASMASEDFAFMLNEVRGAYAWIGNGPVSRFGALHSEVYDFNDAILPVGAQLLAKLVEGPDS